MKKPIVIFNELHHKVWGCNPLFIYDASDVRHYKVTVVLGDNHQITVTRSLKDHAKTAAAIEAMAYMKRKGLI
jgi:hypothetical protein